MTVQAAIDVLKTMFDESNAIYRRDAILKAITALEKEKEPAPQEAETSSNSNNIISNDSTKLEKCQELISSILSSMVSAYTLLPMDKQNIWHMGEIYEQLKGARDLFDDKDKEDN